MSHEESWTFDYDQRDLLFWMSVYQDYELAEVCLEDVRRHFPDARMIVRSDGDDDPRYEHFRDRFDVSFRCGPRLFPVENGGALIQQMLADFLETSQSYLFKIDPDTVVQRPFRFLPRRDGIFGTLQGEEDSRAVQGGCLGLTRRAATALFTSELLTSPLLAQPHVLEETGGYWRKLANRARRVNLASFDWSIGWAANELNLPMFEFPEVYSQWLVPVEDPERKYAVTHPRSEQPSLQKNMTQDAVTAER